MRRSIYCWWVLLASTIAQMCAALSTQGMGVFAGFLQHDFALSNSKVGLLASSLNVAPILGLFFIGRILDCVGERIPIFLGMGIIGISMLVMSFAANYWILLGALFFCGIGYSPIQPGGSKAIHTWFLPRQRGFAMGIRQAALPFGGAMSAIIFPFIIHYSNWRYAAMFASIMVILGGVIFFLIYRNSATSVSTGQKLSIESILVLFKQTNFQRIAVVGIVLVTIQTFILIFWMLFIHQYFHIALVKCAWYLFIVQIFGTLGRIVLSTLGGIMANGYRHVIFIIIIMLLIILLTIIYLPSNVEHWVIMLVSCLLGFFGFGWYGPWVVWLSEESPPEQIGTTLSTSMALNQIAIVVTTVLFGVILDTTGGYVVPWACLIIMASIIFLKECVHHKLLTLSIRY